MAECDVCFRHCKLDEGQTGFCKARICENSRVRAKNYGFITSAALDPIEKKPLKRYKPGKKVLSLGSYGCNLRCPFCQNSDISWSEEVDYYSADPTALEHVSPAGVADTAVELVPKGNIGVAFTYNEPLTGYEFVRDTARLVKERGLDNVLVTNGTASLKVFGEISPYIDAMNIDLKAFTDRFYRELIKGDFEMVKEFIEQAVKTCHVELTTLIIPGENDNEDEIRALSAWIAGLEGKTPGTEIPLHITRFFPRFHMTDRAATPVETVYRLADVARENLKFVYEGNV
ncbi:MAG: AmmeMemoRadiSam system radical SAM enzyme [Lachnospiraceae bacterium]|nr:AmmeMemoRadiSam system radical SAM enzyme [Lachnospiraceae bacterium]